MPKRRRICYVTGSRAEFGLMESTLRAIQSHPKLTLQLIATGMHLDSAHGKPMAAIRASGIRANLTVEWPRWGNLTPDVTAHATGQAISELSDAFEQLHPDVVLLVGDRVEAFAAASAAHISQIPIAHVHGGDRALGQIDDSLRHAITKLSHIHFPATRQSAQRIAKMGEDKFRIHLVGSPGIDGIDRLLLGRVTIENYALLVFHPCSPDPDAEELLAKAILQTTLDAGFDHIVIVYPNNDPGCTGIIAAWESAKKEPRATIFRDLPRRKFLGYLKHAAVLVGNSSSGIIEAASFGTPVINIGDRQKGRERNANVIDVPADAAAIRRALKKVWNNGHPLRFPKKNIYGTGPTSQKIAHILATIPLDERLRRKLIAY